MIACILTVMLDVRFFLSLSPSLVLKYLLHDTLSTHGHTLTSQNPESNSTLLTARVNNFPRCSTDCCVIHSAAKCINSSAAHPERVVSCNSWHCALAYTILSLFLNSF